MDLAFLRGVSKPTRYTGGEVNEVVKVDRPDLLHVALAFPDAYEIGMSYLGLQILYRALNAREDVWAERAFMPLPDMEAALLARGLPLFALESKRPLSGFDLVGFSLVFELAYTNLLHMLRLGGIPLRSRDRRDSDPLIIAGGPCAVNPEPLADFVDAFFIGEGEEGFLEICDVMKTHRGRPRSEKMRAIASVPGIYVPSLYRTEADPTSGMTVVPGPAEEGVPFPIKRRAVWDLDAHPFPSETLVAHHEVVHDRFSAEIARGCSAGCRFCQAGYTYRPYRERSPESVRHTAHEGLAKTGHNEVTLLSLNAGEYRGIEGLARVIAEDGASQRVGVAMPSLRASSLTRELALSLSTGRKSGFTVAPEAGTQRMRDVINKNIAEADVLNAASVVFGSGWNLVKLYFMIGLPTETEEDVDAIPRLAAGVVRAAREAGNRKAQVNLSTSSFVPKPFTPFQWQPMERPESLKLKQANLKESLRRPVTYKWHDVRSSVVEAALSLGDRRVGRAIERAAELGCRLDAWSEHFRFDLWERAFAESGVDVDSYIHRERAKEERLPWDHVDMGVRKEFLWREWEKALAGETTPACGAGSCAACADFAKRCVAGEFERNETGKRGGGETATGQNRDAGEWINPPCPPLIKGGASRDSISLPSPCPPSAKKEAGNGRNGETRTQENLPCPPGSESLEQGNSEPLVSPHPLTPHASYPHHPIPSSPIKYRLRYHKVGPAAFLGHLDLVDVLVRALRRSGARLAYSQGFHPMPKVELAAPLPLGVEGLAERMDLSLTEHPATGFVEALNGILPRGLRIEEFAPLRPRDLPLSALTRQRYAIGLDGLAENERAEVARRASAFSEAATWPVTKRSKGTTKTVDLRARVNRVSVAGEEIAVDLTQGGFMDLVEILAPGPERERLRLARTGVEAPPEAARPPERRAQDLQDAYEAEGTRP